jgi:SAM-dependent methyltransferase
MGIEEKLGAIKMELLQRIRNKVGSLPNEVRMLANGWDQYAKNWSNTVWRRPVRYIGDEWTVNECYGLSPDIVDFPKYITNQLLDPYLPKMAEEGMEIGPGGGRLTALLIERTKRLHVVDSSENMLKVLKTRFATNHNLIYHHGDGATLPPLPINSLDYVIAFDVFVHFEPRLILWYLKQIVPLLKTGGVGIIHYANALTEGGWKEITKFLHRNYAGRTGSSVFGVMCPQLMERILQTLSVQTIEVDAKVIPRDSIAVFRRAGSTDSDEEVYILNEK